MRFFLPSWQFYKEVAPHLELEYQCKNQQWEPLFKTPKFRWHHLFFNPEMIFRMLVKRKLEDLAVAIDLDEFDDEAVKEIESFVQQQQPEASALRVIAIQNNQTITLLEAQIHP